jgi:hypothetical protein
MDMFIHIVVPSSKEKDIITKVQIFPISGAAEILAKVRKVK